MKHIRIAGLCLAGVFVTSIVAVAGASAEAQTKPYMIQCREAANGHWADEQCQTKPGTGNWDTRAAGSMGDETFSSTAGPAKLETTGGKIIECQSGRGSGKLTGDKTGNIVGIIFGCKEPVNKVSCNTKGAAAGEIRTNALKGKIGFLNKAEQRVGLLLEPEKAGGLFAEFECTVILKVKIAGAVISEIEPRSLNTTSKVFYQCYKKAGGKGVQEWKTLEGESLEKILKTSFTGGAEEASAIEVQAQSEFQFDAEIVTS